MWHLFGDTCFSERERIEGLLISNVTTAAAKECKDFENHLIIDLMLVQAAEESYKTLFADWECQGKHLLTEWQLNTNCFHASLSWSYSDVRAELEWGHIDGYFKGNLSKNYHLNINIHM